MSGLKKNVSFFLFVALGLAMGCTTSEGLLQNAKVYPTIEVTTVPEFKWPDTELPQQFQKYWTLRRAGASEQLLDMEAPHIREMIIPARYTGFHNKHMLGWQSINAESLIKITDSLVKISFKMKISDSSYPVKVLFFQDTWLKFDNNWVHVPTDPFLLGEQI